MAEDNIWDPVSGIWKCELCTFAEIWQGLELGRGIRSYRLGKSYWWWDNVEVEDVDTTAL
ncbi:hypothetical protein BELL_0171g00070 [Botrytis elliptica]|uniref:Uncharacterized protein n=1 Tax=Botrytis elliptica TaxID=278938 RepID=A0A4Z1JRC4_9HELO|nr:hypothetical protein BELL_0171g00070 [Botrytis elliptica]